MSALVEIVRDTFVLLIAGGVVWLIAGVQPVLDDQKAAGQGRRTPSPSVLGLRKIEPEREQQ